MTAHAPEEDAEPGPPSARPFGPALHRHARTQLDAAGDWLDVDGKPSRRLHNGVHRGRKALRRVRATLALGQPALGPGAGLVDRELRRIIHSLGDIRDGQALVETLDRLLADCTDSAIVLNLEHARRTAVRRRRTLADATRTDDPGLYRRRALLAVLAGALDALPWATLEQATVTAALQASAVATDRARTRVAAKGRDRDWHRWRRRVRRQSQQYTALAASGFTAGIAQAPTFDKGTAMLLGTAQDLTLLLEHCGRGGDFDKADRHALARYAEAELTGLHERIRRRA